jgi:short-subunit dehydrogenase
MGMYETSSVLITGASQGIGRSIALTFASKTERPLLLLARSEENLRETANLCRQEGARQVAILVCDATRYEDVMALEVPSEFPEPGILINNAGSYLYKRLEETSDDEFRNQIEVNLFTAVNIVKRFLGDLRTSERGLIINICSVGSLFGLADSGAYSSSKHALLGYTRSLREELKDTEIAVTAVNLGQTHSTSWDESDMSPERLINPTDVANLLVTIAQLSSRSVVEEIKLQPQRGRVPAM